jgi:hypothetical protein
LPGIGIWIIIVCIYSLIPSGGGAGR